MTTNPAYGHEDPPLGAPVYPPPAYPAPAAPPGYPAPGYPAPATAGQVPAAGPLVPFGQPPGQGAPAGGRGARLPGWVRNPLDNPNLAWTLIALAQAVLVLCLLGVFAGWGWFVVLTLPLWLLHAANVYLGGAFYESPHRAIARIQAVRAATAPGAPPLPPVSPAPAPRLRRNLVINGVVLVGLLVGTVVWWGVAGGGSPLNTKCSTFLAMRPDQQEALLLRLPYVDMDILANEPESISSCAASGGRLKDAFPHGD